MTIAVALGALVLSGCTAMLVGGAGSGGTRTQTEAGTPASSDSATTAAIRRRFVADPVVAAFDIAILTRAGHVTLRGTVSSYAARARAERLAAAVTGVRRITNEVEVAGKAGCSRFRGG
ncbi:MAG: BON domain-containing protein [Woeseiaceae bacterium]|nr:BON domain-containing protein [Woeseiaceae bacterium]